MNVIFAGSPDFACPSLKQLIASEHHIVGVYTQPDRRSGRGRQMTATPVKQLALQHQLPVFEPTTLKTESAIKAMIQLKPDVMVVVAYGLILPPAVLEIPRLGCINLHPSLLPQWRGAAPIQQALLAGDTTTGITIMQLEEGMDSGPILSQTATSIASTENAGQLHDRLAVDGAKQLIDTLAKLEQGMVTPIVQDHSKATYTKKISKADALIDWQQPAQTIAHQVRAYNPWPIAHTPWQNQPLRIWQASAIDHYCDKPCGQLIAVTKHGIDVNTGNGLLRLEQVQLPGKRPVDIDVFINANQSSLIPHHTYFGVTAC